MSDRPWRRRSDELVASFAIALYAALSREVTIFTSERKLRLQREVDRLEGAPVDRAGTEELQRGEMFGGRVSLVVREPVVGVVAGERDHLLVALGLGEDCRRGGRPAPPVALGEGAGFSRRVGRVQ